MDFKDVINEHLELRRRNAGLEQSPPLARYRAQATTSNQPRTREIDRDDEKTEEFSPDWLSPRKRKAIPSSAPRKSGTFLASSARATDLRFAREPRGGANCPSSAH
jgi:hypothetical protein